MYAQPDSELPPLGVLALVAESNDVARVAAALDVSCTIVRGLASAAARDVLMRYAALRGDPDPVIPDTYQALVQCVKTVVRSDVINVVAILTARERLEVFEAFAYFRAFCNSPVSKLEINHGKV